MALPFKQPPPRPDISWVDVTDEGRPQLTMAQYVAALDTLVRQLAANNVGTLTQAATDAAAAQAGVPVGGLYASGSQVFVRTV
jgi:hypothetical protein